MPESVPECSKATIGPLTPLPKYTNLIALMKARQVSSYLRHLATCKALALGTGVVALLLANLTGCSRSFYRKQADHEALYILNEKGTDDRWSMQDFTIKIDPKSRMYMDYDPDNPPMPPDDAAASIYMDEVDGMEGYDGWDEHEKLKTFENPEWRKHLPIGEDGKLHLDASKALKLALLHSTDYRNQLEQMYLSALDVSAERFDFDTQFYGGYGGNYRTLGAATTGSAASNLSLNTRSIQMRQKYASGATAFVNFANSLMWQFSGPDAFGTTTLLDVNIIQPLLRQGGKDQVLERLTRAERGLLYNVRQYQRYRKGYYMTVTTGQGGGGIQRIGGLFGGSGLSGFTGVGSGGFGGVGGFRGGGGSGTNAGGYMGLLQSQKGLINQRANIVALKGSLNLFESYLEAGLTDFNNVQRTKAQFYREITQLIQQEAAYDGQLDNFINQIGLPPDVEVVIDGGELAQFDLIDVGVQDLQNEILELQERIGEIINTSLRAEQPQLQPMPMPAEQLQPLGIAWGPEVEAGLNQIREEITTLTELFNGVRAATVDARRDIANLEELVPARKKSIDNLRAELKDNPLVPASALESELLDGNYLDTLPRLLTADIDDIERRLEEKHEAIAGFADRVDAILKNGPAMNEEDLYQALDEQIISQIPERILELQNDALELSLVITSARAESIALIPIDLTTRDAYNIASENRLDWMNQRAQLMDQWRLLAFNADRLESDLSLTVRGTLGNTGDDPFRFRDTTGTLQAGVAWDAPITRLRERNIYRQSLLEYQSALRGYYKYEDGQFLAMKNALRDITMQKIEFEANRKQLQVATRNVLFQRMEIQKPPENENERQSPEIAGRLINSLQQLQGSQNELLRVWVGYEINRGLLDFQLGTMSIDENGAWIDPGAIGPVHGYPVAPEKLQNEDDDEAGEI